MTLIIEDLPEGMYRQLEYFAAQTQTTVRTAALFLMARSMSDDPVFKPATPESVRRMAAAERA